MNIIKYKHLDINKIKLNKYNLLYYNNQEFLIQSPVFNNYEIYNYESKKYIILHLDNYKISHLKFLTLIDSIEILLNNNNNSIKTQIITDIQNKKSLKTKFNENTIIFDKNKSIINKLTSNKIILLFKLNYSYNYYSWNISQILQL
jgi:tRNA A37 threonylcarbamoyladenosine biosynthesis protein TsaE